MDSSTIVYVLAPLTLIYLICVIVYIWKESLKLRKELFQSGSVISTMPILIFDNSHRRELISPTTGLPPPPAYTP